MPIKFHTAEESLPERPPVVVVSGVPGQGKTSLACTTPNCVLLDWDMRADQAAKRATRTIVPASWEDIAGIASDPVLDGMEYVITDTVGRALDALALSVVSKDPKNGNSLGGLSLKGYGALKTAYTTWLKMIRQTGRTVILIAHSTEAMRGDDTVQRLDIQGGSKDFVYQIADIMGSVEILDGKRVWDCTPGIRRFGKDPSGVGVREVPSIPASPHVLHDWITEIREVVAKRNEEQAVLAREIVAMRDEADKCETPKALTEMAHANKERPLAIKAAIFESARARDWKWEGTKTEGGFASLKVEEGSADAPGF